MLRLLKILLLWMLFAALPVQGFAASMGMSCGQGHEKAPAAAVSMHVMTDAGMHHRHEGGDDDRHAAGLAHVGSADHAGDHGAHPHTHTSCSACAACCTGAAAPPLAFSPLPALTGGDGTFLAPLPLFVGVVPAGIERPPRAVSV